MRGLGPAGPLATTPVAPLLAATPLAAALLAVGCGPEPAVDTSVEPTLASPSIASTRLSCDADDAAWELSVVADSWAGGAFTHWTRDGLYVERHTLTSISAAPDGSRDELLLNLGIVEDWREASPSATTTFPCGSSPNVVLLLQDLDGKVVDCRGWGPDPGIWDLVDKVAACPNR